ncbi:MAG: c-type cytochrome domain-containing protein, partial [Verrucomicrobiota bacterium]
MSALFRNLILGWISIATSLQAADEDHHAVLQNFFEAHCVKCHGPDKAKSGVRLDELPMHIDDDYAAEEW